MFNFSYISTLKPLSLVVALAFISGCGGGSGSADTPAVNTSVSGRVVDGPLAGSTVVFVDCKDKPSVTTDKDGKFIFPADCLQSKITVTGGQDTTTGLAFTGQLSMPSVAPVAGQQNFVAVSPITTLIEKVGLAESQKIAASLGLSNVGDLLRTDPLSSKELLAKTVAVQQLVEQISQSVTSLNNNLPITEVNAIVFNLLANELVIAQPNTKLNDISLISKAVSQTVVQVKDKLPESLKNNIDNVSQNLAALTSSVIAKNVENTENVILLLPNASTTESLKAAGRAIVEQKTAVTTTNLVNGLAEVLVQDTAKVINQLSSISYALAANNSQTIDTVNALVEKIEVNTGLDLDADQVATATVFSPNHFKIEGFSLGNKNYKIDQLNNSLGLEPVTVSALDNIVIGVSGAGTYATSTTSFMAAIQIDVPVENSYQMKSLALHATELELTYRNNQLIKAILPKGYPLYVSYFNPPHTGTTTTLWLTQDVNVLSDGKIALNANILQAILPSLATQLRTFNSSANSAFVKAVIDPYGRWEKGRIIEVPVAIDNGLNNLRFADKESVPRTDNVTSTYGYGVSANFKIQK